ncbi:hypothetical protein [Maribacter halichondriae]|uniref:hypothetical protein n=1 Tax=Maribacter halichondriae TaxID=2980554 RepID=UPI00235A444A|nr:hypothetical protein [Maribacter sp. Hal144]
MKTQNHIIGLLFLTSSMLTHSQEFKERHVRKLENLGIKYKAEYSFNEQATKDLHQVLHHDFKRRAKNTVGASLLTVGVGGLVGGALIMRGRNYHGERNASAGGLQTFAGLLCFGVGAAGVGTSIPLFVGARKSKKRRDQLRKSYEMDQTEAIWALQAKFLSDSQDQNLVMAH